MNELQVGGHLGVGKMLGKLKERFYWLGMISPFPP